MIRYRWPAMLTMVCVVLLTAFGIVMLYSVTADIYGERFLKLQAQWIALGLLGAGALYFLDYRKLTRRAPWLLVLTGLPLLYLAVQHVAWRAGVPNETLAALPFTPGAINGAFRWLQLGGLTVQPSEFAKVAIIVYVADYYGRHHRSVDSLRYGLLRPLAVVLPLILAIFLGGSLSVTVITGAVVSGMLFVAGIRLRWFLLPVLLGAALLAVAVLHSPARMERLVTFRNPEKYAQTGGYQLWQSQKALGSGGWLGVGTNQSRMKHDYIPEAHTDFVLAIAGEELGYLTMLAVVLLYLGLLGGALAIAACAADRTGMFLATGIGCMLAVQAFVNLGVVSGFLPTTGVTAPLVSYGGSSMVVTWLCIGLLAAIHRIGERERAQESQERPTSDILLQARTQSLGRADLGNTTRLRASDLQG